MILWLAIRDGLYTQSFLLAFGVIREVKCTFCGRGIEDRDQPFFLTDNLLYFIRLKEKTLFFLSPVTQPYT